MAGQFKADAACEWACGARVAKRARGKPARLCGGCRAFFKRFRATTGPAGPKARQTDRESRIAAYTALAGVHLPLFDGRRSDAA